MTIKMIQVNIWRAKFLDRLIEFLRREEPHVVTLQEIAGGTEGIGRDAFIEIQEALRMDGALGVAHCVVGDPSSYFGNAVFVRGKVLDHTILWLRPYAEYAHPIDYVAEGPLFPRNAVDVHALISGSRFHVLSTHAAWTREPTDTPEKIRQAEILAAHLRSLGNIPFVLGGDFNMEAGSKVIACLDAVAKNHVTESSVTNTLNLRTHYAREQLGQGKCVDLIYTSPDVRCLSIDTPDVDVSDHLPVRSVLEVP